MYKLLSILFIIVGLLGIIIPQCIKIDYIIKDMLQGWGVFSIYVGLILMYPEKINSILLVYFIISILHTIYIINKLGYKGYYLYSLIATVIAIIMMLHTPLDVPKIDS
jgi:hypothetical protein